MLKNLPANVGDMASIPGLAGWEDVLEKEMATHSSILAWEIPWTERLGGLHSPWGHKELDTTQRLNIFFPSFVEIYLTNKIVLI